MFTLPVNRNSTVNLSVLGKKSKDRVWKLTTDVQAGITINFDEWIAGDKTIHTPTTTFTLEILFDGVVSSSHTVTSTNQTFINEFIDTDQTTDHSLTFRLTGKQTGPIINDIHTLVKLNFGIEDLVFNNKVFDYCTYIVFDTAETKPGTEFLGQNGELSIPLTTPIYTWLLDNEKLISPK